MSPSPGQVYERGVTRVVKDVDMFGVTYWVREVQEQHSVSIGQWARWAKGARVVVTSRTPS